MGCQNEKQNPNARERDFRIRNGRKNGKLESDIGKWKVPAKWMEECTNVASYLDNLAGSHGDLLHKGSTTQVFWEEMVNTGYGTAVYRLVCVCVCVYMCVCVVRVCVCNLIIQVRVMHVQHSVCTEKSVHHNKPPCHICTFFHRFKVPQ